MSNRSPRTPFNRLCQPKYAAAVGVFYTGTKDDGDPSSWSDTAHVLVAGGIIPTAEGGQYTASDTVDIFREDGIDSATGKVRRSSFSDERRYTRFYDHIVANPFNALSAGCPCWGKFT